MDAITTASQITLLPLPVLPLSESLITKNGDVSGRYDGCGLNGAGKYSSIPCSLANVIFLASGYSVYSSQLV